LEKEVSDRLKKYIQLYYTPCWGNLLSDTDGEEKHIASLQKQIACLQADVLRHEKALQDLYLDKSAGVIEAEQFAQLNRAYLKNSQRLKSRIFVLAQELDKTKSNTDKTVLQGKVLQWLDFDTAPRELINVFIESVEIGKRNLQTNEQNILIHWQI